MLDSYDASVEMLFIRIGSEPYAYVSFPHKSPIAGLHQRLLPGGSDRPMCNKLRLR